MLGSAAPETAATRKKRGKKPRPSGHVKVYKTAVFKIHNPSAHKRAMLKDCMKRAHLAYTQLLAHLLPDVERFASMSKKERNAEMQCMDECLAEFRDLFPGPEKQRMNPTDLYDSLTAQLQQDLPRIMQSGNGTPYDR